jgi:uncharacterized protein YndB with AHSA1/START domain
MPSAARTIAHEVRIAAPPATVFAYFTDPVRMVRWMGDQATLDPRPGGVCRIGMSREVGAAAISGEYVEVVPFSRVVFTWGWEPELFGTPVASTRVEVDLVDDGDGTLVRLAHGRLSDAAAEFHTAGWNHYLGRLAVAAAGGEPGADEWVAPGVA